MAFLSVTRVYCGETREPIEYIFGRYLHLDRNNPPRMGVMGSEILGSLWRYRPTWSNRDKIWHKHAPLATETCLPAKFRRDGRPDGELCGPRKCPKFLQIRKYWLKVGWISFVYGTELVLGNSNHVKKCHRNRPLCAQLWDSMFWTIALRLPHACIVARRVNRSSSFSARTYRWTTATSAPTRSPSSPMRRNYGAPKLWVQREGVGLLGPSSLHATNCMWWLAACSDYQMRGLLN